ncbi:MAG: Rpn family recombination-promoting nuclease/putative transposase, partial [Myxococcota bacterium]
MTNTTQHREKSPGRKRTIKPIRRRDQLFKAVTALRVVWLELARAYLPPEWLPLLDLEGAVLVNTGTVDAALRERLGDLVLKIPFASGNGSLVLGMEQQTRGVFTPARALEYQVRFLKAARKAGKDGKPVAVCTLVFFSGGMPSSQSTELFTGLNEQEKGLARAALGTIIPVELGKIPDGRLRKKGMAGILMMLLKHRRGKPILPLLESLWPDLRAFKEGEDGREFVEKV